MALVLVVERLALCSLSARRKRRREFDGTLVEDW